MALPNCISHDSLDQQQISLKYSEEYVSSATDVMYSFMTVKSFLILVLYT